ncbi:MAG: hypothetical protein ACOX2F_02290 [bacterium]
MKRNWVVATVLATMISLVLSCSYVSRPVLTDELTWEEVEAKYRAFETAEDFDGIEHFSIKMLEQRWATWQFNFIKFKLAKSFHSSGKHEQALEIFHELRSVAPFVNEVHLLAGESALKLKKYDDALKWTLTIYLKLNKDEKIRGSKTVFLAYLYSKRVEKAATWYSMLDEEKKESSKKELEEWLSESETNRNDFNNYLSMTPEVEQPSVSDQIEEAKEELEIIEEEPGAEYYDKERVPNWKSLCVALSSDEKWGKFNEVITSFVNWYFKEYRKNDLQISYLNYLDEKDVVSLFEKAEELQCFAIAGPFFSSELADDFKTLSLTSAIPAIPFYSHTSASGGLLFNTMPSKESEAENIVNYVINDREKKKFAIAYLDNKDGRTLRDLYWETIENRGGIVTDLIDLAPGDNAFFDDVEKVVGKQEDYDEAIKIFRWKNKGKYPNDVLMRRAVERFIKNVPGKCDFEVLVVATPVNLMPMLLPSFPYMNIEFDYYQKYLNRNISVRKHNLRQEGYDWDIQQILVIGPSEITNSEKTIERLGTTVDGMVTFASLSDFSENNKNYAEITKEFRQKHERDFYFIENFIAETCEIIFESLEKSPKETISNYIETLQGSEFNSLLSATAVKFDDKNRMVGKSAVMIGRNKEPFMTSAQIEEEVKRKEEEKKQEKEQAPKKESLKED